MCSADISYYTMGGHRYLTKGSYLTLVVRPHLHYQETGITGCSQQCQRHPDVIVQVPGRAVCFLFR